ncbi:hypothetical protein AB0E59_36015 [Lentzea sp. NPDC034063]|uniref:hypothetical protein n=1 Tax=unclassified Lentzea TaxID=2643253 RepID=UPI0033CEDE96
MRDKQRRSAEARTGVLTFLAGLWLVMAPPLLDFGASAHLFRPYWAALGIAVLILLAGMLRAVAPLDVPWLRTLTVLLAAGQVAVVLLSRAQVSTEVLINQVLVGGVIAVVSLVVAVDSGDWLHRADRTQH